MHVDHRIPLFVGHILNHRVPRVACIVHNDIDAPETVERRLDQLGGKCGVGHIATYHNRLAASSANSGSGLLGRNGGEVSYHPRCPPPAQQVSRTPSATTPGSVQNPNFPT